MKTTTTKITKSQQKFFEEIKEAIEDFTKPVPLGAISFDLDFMLENNHRNLKNTLKAFRNWKQTPQGLVTLLRKLSREEQKQVFGRLVRYAQLGFVATFNMKPREIKNGWQIGKPKPK